MTGRRGGWGRRRVEKVWYSGGMSFAEMVAREPVFNRIVNRWELYFKLSEGLQGNEYQAARDLARAALFKKDVPVHYLKVRGWLERVYGSKFDGSWDDVGYVLGQEIRDKPVMELFLREKMSGADVADLTGGGFGGRIVGQEAERVVRTTRNLMLMVLDVQTGGLD